jgi:hypothetical protein
MYDQIFGGKIIEPHVLSVQMYLATTGWLRRKGLTRHRDDVKRKLANNGAFHIARISAKLWRGGDAWDIEPSKLEAEIKKFLIDQRSFERSLSRALKLLTKVVSQDKHFLSDLDAALKSGTLDNNIDRELYAKKTPKKKPLVSG